jgi:hypothetical protein
MMQVKCGNPTAISSSSERSRLGLRTLTLLALAAVLACGDDPMEPVLSEPGFVVRVSIPGLTDTTFQGDSLYWRFISGPDPVLGRRRELILRLLVLDPPSPLESPLVLEARWHHVANPLPDQRSYDLSFENAEGVFLQANSNLGTWGASSGRITLSEVTDSSLRGDMIVTLTQIYPPEKYLPDVRLRATFWAPHATDGAVDASSQRSMHEWIRR